MRYTIITLLLIIVGCEGGYTSRVYDGEGETCYVIVESPPPAPMADGGASIATSLSCATACRMVLYAFEERNHGGTADGECGLTYECPWSYEGACDPGQVGACFEAVASANGCGFIEHELENCP